MGLVETAIEHVSVKSVLILGPALLLAHLAWWLVLRPAWQEIKLARMTGARPPRIPSKLPFSKMSPRSQVLCMSCLTNTGIDFIYRSVKASMNYQNLPMWKSLFVQANSSTVENRIAGRRVVMTCDPENIKAILATQFGDYGKGEPFHREWKAFLGDSIFTTDGDLWHGSRQLIRPQFIKDRVSDLHVFEKHMQTLFRAIANGGALNGEGQHVDLEAGNGKPVDISDLFFRFTLDSATDFLLGKDVKSLRYALTD